MYKSIYEIFEEFEKAPDDNGKALALLKNNSTVLQQIIRLNFDKSYNSYITEMPPGYKSPDVLPGMTFSNLTTEIRKLYLFAKGNSVADKLDTRRREELFLNIAESLEPKEADVLLKAMNHELKVKGLDRKLIAKLFPNLL